MKAPEPHSNKVFRTVIYHHLDNGAVLVVIFRKIPFQNRILVGARKRRIQDLRLAYHHILVATLVLGSGCENVHIHVSLLVMQVLAHLVRTWDQRRLVFVVSTRLRVAASIPTTHLAGAVPKFVETYCHAESITAPDHVMKGFAVLARSALMRVAIAARSRSRFCVVIEVMSTQVRSCIRQMAVTR